MSKKLTPVNKLLKQVSAKWQEHKVLQDEEDKLVRQRNSIERKLSKIGKDKEAISRSAKPLMVRLMAKGKRL